MPHSSTRATPTKSPVSVVLLLLLRSCIAHAAAADAPAVVLFIVVDDHGWSDCGFTGRSFIQTPTIDSFASEGIVMTNMHVQKVCSPTRTAIMTGRYPHRQGMQTPFCGGEPQGLNLNETLMPEYLADVGYSCHAVGFAPSCFSRSEHDNQTCYPAGGGAGTSAFLHPGAEVSTNVGSGSGGGIRMCFSCNDVEHYSTHLFAARAVDVIHKHVATAGSAPLFLYLPLQDTHGPVQVPSLYKDAAAPEITDNLRRELAGKLAAVDEGIKNVTDALKDAGLLDSTLIAYTTDNGGPIVPSTGAPDDAVGASNWPLRGGKHNAYQGGVKATAWLWDGRGILHPRTPAAARLRVPLVHEAVAAAKSSRPAPSRAAVTEADLPPSKINLHYDGLAHAVDWLPTICGIVGCSHLLPPNPPAGQPNPKYGLLRDGVDLSEAIAQNTTSPRTRVVLDVEKPGGSNEFGSGTVRIGDWKLLVGVGNSGRPGDWSNREPWRNVTGSEPNVWHGARELYNVAQDPEERHNRINDTSLNDTVTELQAFYDAERSVAVYPFSLGPAGHPNSQGVWEPWLPSPAPAA